MIKKILVLGFAIGMVGKANALTYQEFVVGEGGKILDDIVLSEVMPSGEVIQKLYDLSKNVDDGGYDVVVQILTRRWFEADGSLSQRKAELIKRIADDLYSKFCTEYAGLK